MLLSIVMIVKNEEKYLKECLDALSSLLRVLSSELIIVDTGSTDKTPEIAKQYTEKVFFHPWQDDFAAMRNLSISYACGKWILVVDADEILEDSQLIFDFFQSDGSGQYSTVAVKIKNFIKSDNKVASTVFMPRLFNREGLKYVGKVHEQPIYQQPVYFSEIVFSHYGYTSDDPKLMQYKFERNVNLLNKEIQKRPEDLYVLFQLSQSYAMYGEKVTGLEYIKEAYRIAKMKGLDLSQKMYLYNQLIHLHFSTDQFEEAEYYAKESKTVKSGYLDIQYYLSISLEKQNKDTDAIQAYEEFIEMAQNYTKYDGFKDLSVPTGTIDALEGMVAGLCMLFYKNRQYSKVIPLIKLLESNNVIDKIYGVIIGAYVKTNLFESLFQFYIERVYGDSKLEKAFIDALEQVAVGESDEVRYRLWKLFENSTDTYGLLMKVRFSKDEIRWDLDEIGKLDFSELPYYYGDILLKLMALKVCITPFLKNCSDRQILSFFQYLSSTYRYRKRELFKLLTNYMETFFYENQWRIKKQLRKFIMLDNFMLDEDYLGNFKGFIFEGIQDINEIYHPEFFQNPSIGYRLKTNEDVFFYHMIQFEDQKKTAPLEAVRTLRKALKVYPEAKRGIDLLTKEFSEELNQNREFTELANQVKIKMQEAIEVGDLDLTEIILNEYQRISPEDIAIYSVKVMLAMKREDLEQAKERIAEGLARNPYDFDLLCNAGYLYEITGNSNIAASIYRIALEVTQDGQSKQSLRDMIENLDIEIDQNSEAFGVSDKVQETNKNEFAQYAVMVKKKIKELIESQNLSNAKMILEEYNSMVKDDLEALNLGMEILQKARV